MSAEAVAGGWPWKEALRSFWKGKVVGSIPWELYHAGSSYGDMGNEGTGSASRREVSWPGHPWELCQSRDHTAFRLCSDGALGKQAVGGFATHAPCSPMLTAEKELSLKGDIKILYPNIQAVLCPSPSTQACPHSFSMSQAPSPQVSSSVCSTRKTHCLHQVCSKAESVCFLTHPRGPSSTFLSPSPPHSQHP